MFGYAFFQDDSTPSRELASHPAQVTKLPHCPDALSGFWGVSSRFKVMSGNRPQQSAGGASSVPGTSSGTSNSNGGGSNAVISNGNNPGTVVPSRTLAAASGLAVPTLATVPSARGGFASLSRPSGSSGSRKKAHHPAPLYNGLLNSYEDKSNDFVWWVFLRRMFILLTEFWWLFLLLFQPDLLRNDWRGTHDKVWAQFLVSMHFSEQRLGNASQNSVTLMNERLFGTRTWLCSTY